MTDYSLTTFTKDFQSFASGGELLQVLVDNSALFGNIPVRIVKLKTQMLWGSDVVNEARLIMAVYRDTEGATALKLDDEAEVKNATQNGQFYRRPHLTQTNTSAFGAAGHMDHFFKPIILKNVLLDDDDDIVLGFTNPGSTFTASVQSLHARSELWWKRV